MKTEQEMKQYVGAKILEMAQELDPEDYAGIVYCLMSSSCFAMADAFADDPPEKAEEQLRQWAETADGLTRAYYAGAMWERGQMKCPWCHQLRAIDPRPPRDTKPGQKVFLCDPCGKAWESDREGNTRELLVNMLVV
jgi:hypothetical protein